VTESRVVLVRGSERNWAGDGSTSGEPGDARRHCRYGREGGHKTAEALGPGALFLKTDVASEKQVQTTVSAAVRTFGRLDALINNAAIADPNLST